MMKTLSQIFISLLIPIYKEHCAMNLISIQLLCRCNIFAHNRAFLFLFIWDFTSLSTLYRSYHIFFLCAEETSTYSWTRFCNCKLLTIAMQLLTFLTRSLGFEPPTSKVGGECVTTAPPPPLK